MYLSFPSHGLVLLSTNAPSPSSPISYQCWAPMLPLTPLPSAINALTPLPSAINAGHQSYLSLPSHQLSMPGTKATSHCPPISYQCWPPILPLPPLPSAINAGHQCSISLSSHQLSMLGTTAISHYPSIGYQCWPRMLPLTPQNKKLMLVTTPFLANVHHMHTQGIAGSSTTLQK